MNVVSIRSNSGIVISTLPSALVVVSNKRSGSQVSKFTTVVSEGFEVRKKSVMTRLSQPASLIKIIVSNPIWVGSVVGLSINDCVGNKAWIVVTIILSQP